MCFSIIRLMIITGALYSLVCYKVFTSLYCRYSRKAEIDNISLTQDVPVHNGSNKQESEFRDNHRADLGILLGVMVLSRPYWGVSR